MLARLVLHVRRLPGDAGVLVTPVDFPHLRLRAPTLDAARDRLDGLHRRAAGLASFARGATAARNRPRLREVWTAIDEVEDALAVCRLELAGAALEAGANDAIVRVVPVGEGSGGWADELLAMYAAWASRTGREVAAAGERALRIEGLSCYDLLQGEAGLHRRRRAQREPELARVIVGIAGEEADGDADAESGAVVRDYDDGRRRGVRDPRTGERRSHLIAVLEEGKIDPFLLAALRLRRAE